MRPIKNKLNITQINEALEPSKLRNAFSLGLRSIQGGGGGIGATVLIVTVLTLVGITAAFLVEILAAVAGAVLFGALALGMTYYKLYKDGQKLKTLKEGFDVKVANLKRELLDAIKNYQGLLDVEQQTTKEIRRLNQLLDTITDEEERTHISQKITELTHDHEVLKAVKIEMIDRVKVVLDMMQGDDPSKKLTALFGQSNDSIVAEALTDKHFTEEDREQIKRGVDKFVITLGEPITNADKAALFRAKLSENIQYSKPTTHKGVKWLTTGLAGLGGLLGGAGSVITISALVLGGMAAVTGVGLPIAIAALGFGLIAAGISIYYQRRVENRQTKILNQINRGNTQVTGMTEYLTDEINRPVAAKVTTMTNNYQQATREIVVRLDEHRKTFKKRQVSVSQQTQRIKSLMNEVKFHKFRHADLAAVRELRELIGKNILRLEDLLEQVHAVAITAGSEIEKTGLIQDIQSLLVEANKDKADTDFIYGKIDLALHQPVEAVSPAPVEVDQKNIKSSVEDVSDIADASPVVKPRE